MTQISKSDLSTHVIFSKWSTTPVEISNNRKYNIQSIYMIFFLENLMTIKMMKTTIILTVI